MTQLTLFDRTETPARISRRSDPITSRKSAAETEQNLGPLHQSFLCCLASLRKPSTANEVAKRCVELDGRIHETYRKRAGELASKKYGCLIVQDGERKCEATGKTAMTFKVKERT